MNTADKQRVQGTVTEVHEDHAVIQDSAGGVKYVTYTNITTLEDRQQMKEQIEDYYRRREP